MSTELEYEGVNALGRVLQNRMQETANKPLVLDFGVIQADGSLRTNTYTVPIPKSDYVVCRSLTYGAAGSLFASISGGSHGGHETGNGSHSHSVSLPGKMRSLQNGDRVLVAWVGNDAVVIDIIVNGSAV